LGSAAHSDSGAGSSRAATASIGGIHGSAGMPTPYGASAALTAKHSVGSRGPVADVLTLPGLAPRPRGELMTPRGPQGRPAGRAAGSWRLCWRRQLRAGMSDGLVRCRCSRGTEYGAIRGARACRAVLAPASSWPCRPSRSRVHAGHRGNIPSVHLWWTWAGARRSSRAGPIRSDSGTVPGGTRPRLSTSHIEGRR
jgi:hypothetical protein